MAFLSDSPAVPGQAPAQASQPAGQGRAEARYHELAQERASYLERARACAKLTIPYLIPPDELGEGQTLPTPYQSVGANGVTNLASKLLITMLPPNEPCFRLRVSNMMQEKQEEEAGDKEFSTKIERALSRIERAVLADIEDTADRPVVYEGNLHLLVGGNVLYYDDPEKGLRLFPLSRYVLSRDPSGNAVEILTEESADKACLPPDILDKIRQAEADTGRLSGARGRENEVTIYTHLTRQQDRWRVYQECGGHVLPGSEGSYKAEAFPWIPVRMYAVAGESYGRSYVELQLGDLLALESFEQALLEGSAASARILFFVDPNASTSARAVAEAQNGDVLEGRAEDVSVLQVEKGADLQIAAAEAEKLTLRLKTAFLMLDALRRDAERVTAEEIRAVAQELETALGGVYTVISQEFQLPYITSRMTRLTRQHKIPELPRGVVRPSVVTGFEALGRGNDKARLLEFLSIGQQSLGPAFLEYLNPLNALTRLAASMGIATEGLIKEEEDLMQERQQSQQAAQGAQMQSMVEKLGPKAMELMGNQAPQTQQTPPMEG